MLNQYSHERGRRSSNNFWKFWLRQTISMFGSSFTRFALPLLVYRLTASSLNLALTVTATVLPYLLFGLVIGAWADRVNRKRLMVFADLARAVITASIPLVSLLGLLSVWWIYAVAFLISTLTICFEAANFAALTSLVSQEDIVAANGRLQAGYAAAQVGGPLLGGLLIIVIPLPMLLLIDAASYLLSVGSLLLISSSFNMVTGESQAALALGTARPRDTQRTGAPHKRQKVSVPKGIGVVGRPCAYPTYPCHLA